jgi:carboxymethylenebutenolidase
MADSPETTVEVATTTGAIPATLAVPTGQGVWPGVVVVRDAFGMSDDIRRNACRFVDNGYLAIAGLCMGGGFALVMGAKGLDVSAPFYPSIVRDYGFLDEGSCPVVPASAERIP